MAKKNFKQTAHTRSDDAGCLSGFMGIFDFHVGHYSQKLLYDKKHGNSRGLVTGYSIKKHDFPSKLEEKHEDVDVSLYKDGVESRGKGFDSGIASVKTLMEEEMSKIHITKIQNNELEQSHSESRFGIHLMEKNNKKSKKGNVVPDHHVNDLRYANGNERSSMTNELAAFMVQFYCDNQSHHIVQVDLPLQPQQLDFHDNDDSAAVLNSSDVEDNPITWFDEKEVVYGFVRTLVQVSGMSCYMILERWNSSNQLLDQSLLEEVGIIHSLLPDDSKLLFDCMNEVLVDTRGTLFGSTPWVSLIKPSSQVILRGEELIEEVCKSVYGHLQLSQFTLDHAVRKDIDDRSWMDHRFEMEDIVIEMADDILEEILKKTMCK